MRYRVPMPHSPTANDLTEVVERLYELTERLEEVVPSPLARLPELLGGEVPLHMMEAIYAGRRLRTAMFGADADLFGEPAWDMLLDAAIMEGKGKRVSVTSACLAAGVPGTTALRYLAALEERNLLAREADPLDSRRKHVRLTAKGKRLLRKYFGALADGARRSLACERGRVLEPEA